MRALSRLARLSWRERSSLLGALGLVWAIRLRLWLQGYARTRAALAGAPPAYRHSPIFIAWSVRQAARLTPWATCLVQGLAVQHLMTRSGYASDLRIGARRGVDQKFEAHAWVVHDGDVIIGGTEQEVGSYSPLIDLPAQK